MPRWRTSTVSSCFRRRSTPSPESAHYHAHHPALLVAVDCVVDLCRGGGGFKPFLVEIVIGRAHVIENRGEDLIDFNELLTRLACEDAEAAELVKLRLFGGLSVDDAGEVLGMSRSVAYENWKFARAWFTCHGTAPGS